MIQSYLRSRKIILQQVYTPVMYLLKRDHHIHLAFASEQELFLTGHSKSSQHWLSHQMVGRIFCSLKCSEAKIALCMGEK